MVSVKESTLFLTVVRNECRGMFQITCPHCNQNRLVSTQQIKSMHRSAEGTVAYVGCPCGNTMVHLFARLPKPLPKTMPTELADPTRKSTAA